MLREIKTRRKPRAKLSRRKTKYHRIILHKQLLNPNLSKKESLSKAQVYPAQGGQREQRAQKMSLFSCKAVSFTAQYKPQTCQSKLLMLKSYPLAHTGRAAAALLQLPPSFPNTV